MELDAYRGGVVTPEMLPLFDQMQMMAPPAPAAEAP